MKKDAKTVYYVDQKNIKHFEILVTRNPFKFQLPDGT